MMGMDALEETDYFEVGFLLRHRRERLISSVKNF